MRIFAIADLNQLDPFFSMSWVVSKSWVSVDGRVCYMEKVAEGGA